VHTDYIGSEERCRFIARRLIYWVAAVAVTGGAADATGIMDVVRAHANTAPFLSRTAAAPAKQEPRTERRTNAFIALPAQPAPRKRTAAEAVKPDTVKPAALEIATLEPKPAGRATEGATPFEPVAIGTAGPATFKVEPSDTAPAAAETARADAAPKTAAAVDVEQGPVADVVAQPVDSVLAMPDDDAEQDGPAERAVFSVASATPFAPVDLPAVEGRRKIDPHFEAALTSLALQHSVPQAIEPGEEIPTEHYPRRTAGPTPADPAAAASPVAGEPAASAAAAPLPLDRPAIKLPALAELPLPRPRPPLTPAQELGLNAKERAKAEDCLARAIYFEARNEPIRGQIAVAQVVLNRVFSPYYPDTICGVVYQNAHRRLACQFTFACDGIPDIVRERGPWLRAQKIANQALDAQVWLTDVAKSTHYHATYVRPHWIREMKRMVKHGQHIFYRPRRWGDGHEEAGWGVASLTHSAKPKLARN
jgi:hypothetical protein